MSTSSSLKISVVIPTYHRNDLLARCLECLAPTRQTIDSALYEVVVTDDGRQETAEKMVAEQFPFARWTKGPQRGPGANRNHGVTVAQGEWIALTDDDCLPSPEWLQSLFQAMERYAGEGVELFEGKTTCEAGLSGPLDHAPVNLQGGWLWSCNLMIHRVAFEGVGKFDEAFPHPHMEDVDFRERAVGQGVKFVFVPSAVIDHPPRKLATGLAMGRMHESAFLMYYKGGNRGTPLWRLLRLTLRARLLHLFRTLNRETVQAAVSLWREMSYLLRNAPAWERKYKALYAQAESPYLPDFRLWSGKPKEPFAVMPPYSSVAKEFSHAGNSI